MADQRYNRATVQLAPRPVSVEITSYGDTREAALESTREAIAGYLEATEDGIPLPRSGPEPSIVELEVSLP